MVVVDASAAIEVVVYTQRGEAVLDRVGAESLHAPHLLGVEVTQALRRYARVGSLSLQRAAQAVDDFMDLDIVRYPHELLLRRAWSVRENVTAYDGVYVALAEVLAAPLLTTDQRLARSSGHGAVIELVG